MLRSLKVTLTCFCAVLLSLAVPALSPAQARGAMEQGPSTVIHARQQVGEVDMFYREAGPKDAPVILLLHGYPSSSHMFRDLIWRLSDRYRVIAPDLPGFGSTIAPPRGEYDYTFENLTDAIWAASLL